MASVRSVVSLVELETLGVTMMGESPSSVAALVNAIPRTEPA